MMFLVYFFGSVIAKYLFCLPICSRAGVCELECEWDTVKKHEGQAVLDTDNSHTFQIHRYSICCTVRARLCECTSLDFTVATKTTVVATRVYASRNGIFMFDISEFIRLHAIF